MKSRKCAEHIRAAKSKGAAILLIYGAHLLRNGAALILDRMMEQGWVTHLATNGAGSIHDWEYSFLGRSTEKVEENVAAGTFGAWDETGRYIHLALMAGALDNLGYGGSLGRFICEEELTLPERADLEQRLRQTPGHPLAPAWADLLKAQVEFDLPSGKIRLAHPWKHASIFGQAFRRGVPLTVHPGIGYDIISNHPMFNGAVLGRAAALDFRQFAATVDRLDNGVVLSVGSAIMGPQVFEKSLSCVHNLRFQQNRPPVQNHAIYVVDMQEGNWDWSAGRAAENQSGVLSSLLQKLLADGREDALSLLRQCRVYPPPLSSTQTIVTPERFQNLTGRFSRLKIAIIGDFCLDRYLEIDPGKKEISIETKLPVHNVVRTRSQPGAAGTILNNLVALGIGDLFVVGFAGVDGEGFELRRALESQKGVHLDFFLTTPARRTFTYTKPLVIEAGKPPVELNRLDLKNWSPTPAEVSRQLAAAVEKLCRTG